MTTGPSPAAYGMRREKGRPGDLGRPTHVMATLSVYIDIYNIFVNLLNLLLAFAGNRD